MGGCASSQRDYGRKSGKRSAAKVIKVIHLDGRVKEFEPPICAEQILSCNPGCFLCSSDTMSIDSYPTNVPEPEELRPGLYFLLSKAQENKPFSLEDLCELAVKASSNLSIHDLQLSFRHYAVV